MTIKNVEICPGYDNTEKGSYPYSGDKFGGSKDLLRISDPVYGAKTDEVEAIDPSYDDVSTDSSPEVY